MESVYLETTFVSYLVAKPSRDLIVAANPQVTIDWWTNRRANFEWFISQVVIDESSQGDPSEVQKRLAVLAELPLLRSKPEAESLAAAMLATRAIPAKAATDASHMAWPPLMKSSIW